MINGKTVDIKGKIQGRSTLIATNSDNGPDRSRAPPPPTGRSAEPAAGDGHQPHHDHATDPAGNESSAELTVRRGTGKLVVSLEATDYSISRRALPQPSG